MKDKKAGEVGMVGWVLGEVGGSSSNGLTIETLFSNFEASFANGDPAQLWQQILQSPQLEIGDDAKSSAALSKLALSDVLALGLGSKLVRAKTRKESNAIDAKGSTMRKTRGAGRVAATGSEAQDVELGLEARSAASRRVSIPKKVQNATSEATRISPRRKRSAGTITLDDSAVKDVASRAVPENPFRKGRRRKGETKDAEQAIGDESVGPSASTSNNKEDVLTNGPTVEPQHPDETETPNKKRTSTRSKRKIATSQAEMENVQLPDTPSQDKDTNLNFELEDFHQPNPDDTQAESTSQITTSAEGNTATSAPPKKKRGRPAGNKAAPSAAAAASKEADGVPELSVASPGVGESQAVPSTEIAEYPTSQKKPSARLQTKKDTTSILVSAEAKAIPKSSPKRARSKIEDIEQTAIESRTSDVSIPVNPEYSTKSRSGRRTPGSVVLQKDNLFPISPKSGETSERRSSSMISVEEDIQIALATVEPHTMAQTAHIPNSSDPVGAHSVASNLINTQDADKPTTIASKKKRKTEQRATGDTNLRKKIKRIQDSPVSNQEYPPQTPQVARLRTPHQSSITPDLSLASSNLHQYQDFRNPAQISPARGAMIPEEYMNMEFRPHMPPRPPFSATPPSDATSDKASGLKSINAPVPISNTLPQSLAQSDHTHSQNSLQTLVKPEQTDAQRLPGRIEDIELQRQQTEALMKAYKSPFASAPSISRYSQPVQHLSSAVNSDPKFVPPFQAARPSPQSSNVADMQMENPEVEKYPSIETVAGIIQTPAQARDTSQLSPGLPHSSTVKIRMQEGVPPSNVEAAATSMQNPANERDSIQPLLKSPPQTSVQMAPPEVERYPNAERTAVLMRTSAQAADTKQAQGEWIRPLGEKLDPETQDCQDSFSVAGNGIADSGDSALKGQQVIAERSPNPATASTSAAHIKNSPWALKRQNALALSTGVAKAQAISFPENIARLATYYNGDAGNLVLSDDKIYLQFVGIDQLPPQLPNFSIRISQLTEDPIVSTRKGANTDNLQIRINEGTAVGVRHWFKTVHTDNTSNPVNEMRAKIVNARLFIEFNGDEDEAELALKKPFKCNTCGLRLKNKNGLEYHITKAATTCNPNFDPSTLIGKAKKRGPQPKLGVASESPKSMRKKAPQAQKTTPSRPRAARAKAVQRYGDTGSSSSSDDSIMEWATSVATQGVDSKPAMAPQNTKKYRALPGETALLERLAKDFQLNAQIYGREGIATEADVESEREISTTVKHFSQEICEEVLLGIVQGNNGIFPGDRGIWYALFSVWVKEYPSLAPPESKLCSAVLDELVADDRLKKVDFEFPDLKSRVTTRSIYLMPGFDMKSPIVEMMKELIRTRYPRYYVPSQFAPPAPIHKKLEALDHRALGTKQIDFDDGDLESSSEDSGDSECHLDSSSADEGGTVREKSDISKSVVGLYQDTDLDSDPYIESGSPGKRKRKSRNIPRNSRGPNLKSKGSNNIAKWHARRKTEERSPFVRPKNKAAGLSTRASRKKDAPSGIQTWATALSHLPNPETGAWSTVPVRFDPPMRPRESYRGRLLAEPVTFLQELNGAWSQRPFGHGARPIYSRPSRRAAGNPNLQNYLSKIQNGHRPILYPPTKNQMNFPAAPSKKLLTRNSRRAAARVSAVGTTPPDTPDDEDMEDLYVPDEEDAPELLDTQAGRKSSTFSASPSLDITDSVTEDSLGDEPPAKRTRRAAATYSRSKPVLDEVQIVNFYEPKKLVPGGPRNPGLDSMPSTYGLSTPGNIDNADESHQLELYTTVTFVEPQIVNLDLNFHEGSWTIAPGENAQLAYIKVTFDHATAFDVESLPYDLLTIDDDIDKAQSSYARSGASGRTAKSQPKPRRSNLPGLQRLNTSRFMTALPIDFQGVLNESSEAVRDFGIQVANPASAIQSRKRFRGTDELSTDAEARFLVFVVVIRTVAGGLDQLIDWVLVSTYFPDHSINYLNKLWNRISTKKKDVIDDLIVDFQDAFLVAYKNGTVPPIDFDNLVGYDWAELVDWTIQNIDTSFSKKAIDLPANRNDIKRIYHYKEHDREDNDIQETYFGLATAVYKRMEAVSSMANSIPILPSTTSSHDEISDFMLAKSWARATALTPQADWNASVAKTKLAQAGLKLVAKALDELMADKVISKRRETNQPIGRSYEEGDALTFMGKKQVQSEALAEAYMYKQFLDAEFRSGKSHVRADYMGNEGSYMCVTSLMAHGSLKLVGVDIPMDKWGLGDEDTGYETKKIPKSRLRWEMDMYPTNTYVFDEDNTLLQNMQWVEAPGGSQTGEIPIWYGITNALIPIVWRKVLVSVSGLVALRSGITTKGLEKALKPVLEEWEIRLLLEWGTMMGIFQKLGRRQGTEGWGVGDMWWCLVGSVCAGQLASIREVKAVEAEEEEDEDEVEEEYL